MEAPTRVSVRPWLPLGGIDLTSPARTMGVIAAIVEFERDLLIERTQAGLARARAQGRVLGRPTALSAQQLADVRRRLAAGETVAQIARTVKTSRQTIMRARDIMHADERAL